MTHFRTNLARWAWKVQVCYVDDAMTLGRVDTLDLGKQDPSISPPKKQRSLNGGDIDKVVFHRIFV